MCDEEGGECIDEYTCKCKDGFTTLPIENKYFKFCNYHKKSKISTATIELFLGFGMGHFYAERNINGFFKLFIYMFLYMCNICVLVIALKIERDINDRENSAVKFFFFVYYCFILIILIWQIFDFFMIIFGFLDDGNNIPLY